MALAVNTSHSLAANLVSLIGVDDDGVLKDFQRPSATFSISGSCSYGSGTYGRHIRTAQGASSNALGATVSPIVPLGNTAKPNGTILVVLNAVGARYSVRGPLVVQQAILGSTVGLAVDSAGAARTMSGTAQLAVATTANVGSGAHTLALTRTGQTSYQLYVDGAFDVGASAAAGTTSANTGYDTLGGFTTGGFGYAIADFVYVAAFDRVLTAGEISDLHASLTGSNAFSLVITPPQATASISLDALLFAGSAQPLVETALALTLDDVVWSGVAGQELPPGSAAMALTLGGAVPYASAGTGAGRITSPPIKNNAGTVYANDTNVLLFVYHPTTGALLATRTGLATNGSGVLSILDTALAPGQAYRVVGKMSDGAVFCADAVAGA